MADTKDSISAKTKTKTFDICKDQVKLLLTEVGYIYETSNLVQLFVCKESPISRFFTSLDHTLVYKGLKDLQL